MDFGKLPDVSGVDFTLPPENPITDKILLSKSINKPLEVYIGPPIWAMKDWVGKIYPSNAKEKDYLHFYTRQFNTIELNVTHYQIPTPAMIVRWKEEAVKGFKFCPKFPQAISHDRQLIGAEALTEEFCNAVLQLGDNLGRTFLQLSPMFEPKQLKNLERYLKSLPEAFPVSVEFRHEQWFANKAIWKETCTMLEELGVGTVMSDVAGRRDVLHMTLTTNDLMLRFVGNELHPTDYKRTDEWCHRITDWIQKGLRNIFIFIHCGENKYAPELTQYWIKKLNNDNNLRIAEPKITPQVVQGSLF
ncbi:DUF72 domain-containing protein [Emticicia sp. BO119]|uniref:DUF72 domain-containing protein n=1 Tax=Emticicia sp. BO119 TaxID=2757768 RepID=UPI0015F0A4F3|nr:DUF72 domain-containing protein [Emticicia sp. BO119]MBA4851845.1 DUF72 domain-containing protein [Emticicia sp. BO119]